MYIEIFSRTFSFTGVAGPAGDDVRHDADFHQPLDAELGGLGLLLAEGVGLEDVGQGDEDDRAFAFLVTRAGGRLRGRTLFS